MLARRSHSHQYNTLNCARFSEPPQAAKTGSCWCTVNAPNQAWSLSGGSKSTGGAMANRSGVSRFSTFSTSAASPRIASIRK
jgi:hypothetical protein